MLITGFDVWPAAWRLQSRIAASCAMPTTLSLMGCLWVFGFADRGNHAVGGAALFWAFSLFWNAVQDLVEFWPWRQQRDFERPVADPIMGAARQSRSWTATILPFRRKGDIPTDDKATR